MLYHTHKKQSFAGEIGWDKGLCKKKLEYIAPRYVQQFLNLHTKVGDSVTVTITLKKPSRTIAQNNYYWGVYLPAISEETGEEDIDGLHELFKGMFLTKTIKEILGKKVRKEKSTTELTVVEFIEYIMEIEKFTGIPAPPTENYNLPSLKH